MKKSNSLNCITLRLAKKVLSKPGMVVEPMRECFDLFVGNHYEVVPSHGGRNDLGIKYGNGLTGAWLANRFRRAIQ